MNRKTLLFASAFLPISFICAADRGEMCEKRVDLYSYSLPQGNSGLRLAWRADSTSRWIPLGKDFNFVSSDFGAWGSHKKMFAPKLIRNRLSEGWTCIWEADPSGGVTAVATSPDLIKWNPQAYYNSVNDIPRDIFPASPLRRDSVVIDGVNTGGYVQSVGREVIDRLISHVSAREAENLLYSETLSGDSVRFAGLKPFSVELSLLPGKDKPITDKLIGIFFEDINYAADGGLYAELIRNRDFEYSSADNWNGGNPWNAMTAWSFTGDGTSQISSDEPLHPNNPHFIRINSGSRGASLSNSGFDGIAVKRGEAYRFSLFARCRRKQKINVELAAPDGRRIGETSIEARGDGWKRYSADIKAKETLGNAHLVVTVKGADALDIDVISLFPKNTFNGRDNGLRADLAQALADLRPRFVRFPGGCVAHGNGVDNIYDWKGSIGPVETRRPLPNLWGYHQTRGLGYYEYFLFCEDIGAEPLPVLAAGVPCQNSSWPSHHSVDKVTSSGQQNGIPMDEMDAYIADVLDLIEYANGDAATEWGARRAAAGHPKPFNLKYIGIGNEDMITEVFESRYRMICEAVAEKYPEVKIVGTVGPFNEGADYDRGWELAREMKLPLVDEHYYVSPGWLVNNRDYYDNYPRNATKVYLGEWASHLPGRPSNIETALSEALYLTDLERNGDVVEMTSYAPLLAKEGHTQWRPDLIYFNNTDVKRTPDYYVQQLFGQNPGAVYLSTSVNLSDSEAAFEAAGISSADILKRLGVSLTKSADGRPILKMVNYLTVEVTVNLPDELNLPAAVRATQLSGSPDDSEAAPESATVSLPAAKLPPYSFTIITL